MILRYFNPFEYPWKRLVFIEEILIFWTILFLIIWWIVLLMLGLFCTQICFLQVLLRTDLAVNLRIYLLFSLIFRDYLSWLFNNKKNHFYLKILEITIYDLL